MRCKCSIVPIYFTFVHIYIIANMFALVSASSVQVCYSMSVVHTLYKVIVI